MKLSAVTPVYRNQSTLEELARRVFQAAAPLYDEVEYVFVVDGSPDGSLGVLRRMAAESWRPTTRRSRRWTWTGRHHDSGSLRSRHGREIGAKRTRTTIRTSWSAMWAVTVWETAGWQASSDWS